ncbi:Gfo/Idh/MocA family oxidoreductase [Burkholderia sp. Ac-20365]|jgi:predicted dehydrogenase|uniref:Gfo/Idh/MocA family protein n=1 Tax=Burkholderia sp. Ac-20365 TaxID=2703897 RepID=UPI00197BD0A1|nr:Gfo/Idh/MocA family oxidoreductase [Burkholderia sp. Ac-20365]MBN3763505.1 Gfo/Idh/MocA family oxidoreductase [Burkholderia sp. Ac-20365]
MKRIQLAIIGCGWAGDIHVEGLRPLADRIVVRACVDPNAARRDEFARRHGIPVQAASLADVLAMKDIDAVVICTPPVLHHPMAVEALDAHKHVICEKPLTSSMALVDDMRAAEARSNARLMPIFQYRFGNGAEKVRRAIASGAAGRHFVTTVEIARTRGADYYREAWRGKFATELGGIWVTQAIHIHDLVYSLLGPAVAVTSFRDTRVNPIEVEDCGVACLKLADGSLVSVGATLGSVGQQTRIRMCFENVTFERLANHDLERIADDPWIVLPRSEQAKHALDAAMAQEPDGFSYFTRQYELFYEAITSGTPFPVSLDDARASIELVTALYLSAQSGETVSLPITRDQHGYHGWTTESV